MSGDIYGETDNFTFLLTPDWLKRFEEDEERMSEDKFEQFIKQGGGWWCPKCQRGVQVTFSETKLTNTFSSGKYDCNECGLTLHMDVIPSTSCKAGWWRGRR